MGKRMPRYQGKAASAASLKVGNSKKERRLIRKRVREYNSDDEEDFGANERDPKEEVDGEEERAEGSDSDGMEEEDNMEGSGEDDDSDDGETQQGITKFTEGCRAFRTAFTKIMKKSSSSEPLGPVLSAHKKLVAEKLAEELAEEKVKVEDKKAKHLIAEKGHVQPVNFLDSKDKFLISVATKGVVKLFNAVNKAQKSQQGLNPAKSKDSKVMAKRRKDAFLSELQKPMPKASKEKREDDEGNDKPGWAPLCDDYMLTNPKFKDWDKMPDPSPANDTYKTPLESSDED